MPSRKRKISVPADQKPLFFDSLNVMELPVNPFLPGPEILKLKFNKRTNRCSAKVVVPDTKQHLINIYYKINGEKKDMYYQVGPGTYTFSSVLEQEYNLLEIFYTYGNSRSASVSAIYEKGEK
jgi:hypothetical protein